MPALLSPVVVATDLSAGAATALAYALGLAGGLGAEVHLLHVLSWPDAGRFEAPGDAATAVLEEAGEDARVCAALAEAAGDRAVVRAVRRSQVPALAIAAHAREVGAGLVVVGARGRRTDGAGLGAVAAETLATAPCDVLVVPAGVPAAAPRRLLVGVDGLAASRPLLDLGLALAAALAAAVDVVHVVAPLPYPLRWVDEALLALVPAIRERAADALRTLAETATAETATDARDGGRGARPEVSLYVEQGAPARTLLRVADALGDDLVLVGPHAPRVAFDRLLGSVADRVTRQATRPVLVAQRSAGTDEAPPDAPGDEAEAWSR